MFAIESSALAIIPISRNTSAIPDHLPFSGNLDTAYPIFIAFATKKEVRMIYTQKQKRGKMLPNSGEARVPRS
jgi:hypothetical protein